MLQKKLKLKENFPSILIISAGSIAGAQSLLLKWPSDGQVLK